MAECPICQSAKTTCRYRLGRYDVAQCSECDIQFNNRFRGGGKAGDFFSEQYFRDRHHEAFRVQFENPDHDPSYDVYRRWMEEIERRVPVGRLLDVGCALGTFLLLARNRGWDASGVEISEFAANHARRLHRLPVHQGTLADFDAPEASYDVVTFWDSIEHVGDPAGDLKKACRLLRPRGLLLATTDNFDCLLADVAKWIYRLSCGYVTYALRRLFIDANLAFFTERTFRRLLGASGFDVILVHKMEYPIDKIKTNVFERSVLTTFYCLAGALGRQAQITVIAQKT